MSDRRRGNCYYASEALFHILGGRRAGWKAMRVTCTHVKRSGGPVESDTKETHWFLRHESGLEIDPAGLQFRATGWWAKPDYTKAVGTGFMTRRPSKGARAIIRRLTWQRTNKPAKRSTPVQR